MTGTIGRGFDLFASVSMLLLLALLTASAPAEDRNLSDLGWTGNGQSLLVAGKWRLDITSGEWSELIQDQEIRDAGQQSSDASTVVSPDGEHVLVLFDPYDGAASFWIQGAHESERPIPVPVWFRPDENGADVQPGEARHVLAWLDAGHVYVHQFHPTMGFDDRCGIWDVPNGAWLESAPCMAGDFHATWKIQPGPEGSVAVYSAGEGHPGVLLARYDRESGQTELGAPELDLYPAGPAEVHFGTEGRVFFSSPCLFDQSEGRPCEHVLDDESAPWKLYSWQPGDSALQLVRQLIPASAAPHPGDPRTLAWARNSAICVGDPASKSAPRCFPVPSQ